MAAVTTEKGKGRQALTARTRRAGRAQATNCTTHVVSSGGWRGLDHGGWRRFDLDGLGLFAHENPAKGAVTVQEFIRCETHIANVLSSIIAEVDGGGAGPNWG